MVKSEPIPFVVGDVVRLKKPHPCGGFDWRVVRLGADIGIKCQSCGRRVLLPRRDLERRMRVFVDRGSATDQDPEDVNLLATALATRETGH